MHLLAYSLPDASSRPNSMKMHNLPVYCNNINVLTTVTTCRPTEDVIANRAQRCSAREWRDTVRRNAVSLSPTVAVAAAAASAMLDAPSHASVRLGTAAAVNSPAFCFECRANR
jgi:hypothetical protein